MKLLDISLFGNVLFFSFLASLSAAARGWSSYLSIVPFLATRALRFQAEDGKLVLLWFGVYECENQGIFALTLSPAAFQHVCLIPAVFMSELSH